MNCPEVVGTKTIPYLTVEAAGVPETVEVRVYACPAVAACVSAALLQVVAVSEIVQSTVPKAKVLDVPAPGAVPSST